MLFSWSFLVLLLLRSPLRLCEDQIETEAAPTPIVDDKIPDITEDDFQSAQKSAESHTFMAEVDRMMKLIINSLYSKKEIFLRELISNASDALEKIQFRSITDPSQMTTKPELGIWIKADPAMQTISILDSGIGMTKEQLISNLGTLAKSGTSDFIKGIENTTDVNSLIGQFGVGFYSSFLVADRVTVISKSNDDNDQYIWQSDSASFTISKDPRGNTLGRGTLVILHLRENSAEYLETSKLTDLIKKYSEFIDFKIHLRVDAKDMDEKPEPETSTQDGVKVSSTKEEETSSETSKDKWGYKLMNKVKPIWLRKPKNITEEEYAGFYSAITRQTNATPLLTLHFSAEGETSFRCILFVPKSLPDKFFQSQSEVPALFKLYVRRIFITEATKTTLPRFLWYLPGVIDSDDLPLNVGRENLQQSPLNSVMKKKITKKFLDFLFKLSPEKYQEFWKEFGTTIKMGIMEDSFHQARLVKLLRLQSSHHSTNLTTLEDYLTRMKKDQMEIYYIAGTSRTDLEKSPLVQKLLRKGYEIIFFTDPIDEYMMQHLQDFESKRFQSVAKDGFRLPKGERASKRHAQLTEDFKPLFDWFTSSSSEYKDSLSSVRISERTDSSPCLLISDRYGWTGNMQRLLRSQAYANADKDETYKMRDRKHLEVNPKHPLIKRMLELVNEDKESEQVKELATACYSIASLSSGYTIDNNLKMATLLESLTARSLGIDPKTVAETIQHETEEEVEEEEEDEEDKKKIDPSSVVQEKKDSDDESTLSEDSEHEPDSKTKPADSSTEAKDEL